MEDILKKGQTIVEPGIAISEFVEKINKLSYQNFPEKDVIKFLRKSSLPKEFLEPYLFFSDVRYTRNLIHKSDSFELVVNCWRPGQHTSIHSDDGKKSWIRVEQGSLKLTGYREESSQSSSIIKKLDSRVIDGGAVEGKFDIYKVETADNKDAISLHLYVPILDKIVVYDESTNQKREMGVGYHSVHGKLVAPEETR